MNHSLLEHQASMLYRRLTLVYGDFYYNMSITRRQRMKHAKDRAFNRWVRRSNLKNASFFFPC